VVKYCENKSGKGTWKTLKCPRFLCCQTVVTPTTAQSCTVVDIWFVFSYFAKIRCQHNLQYEL